MRRRLLLLLAIAAVGADTAASTEVRPDSERNQESTALPQAVAEAESLLALAHADRRDRERAIGYVERAIELARRADALELQARGASTLARLYERARDLPTAIGAFLESADLLDRAGRPDLAIGDRVRGAGLMVDSGRLSEGLELLESARAHASDTGDVRSLAFVLYNLARVHQRTGDLDAALADCERIEQLAGEHELDLRARCRGRLVRARVLKDMGRLNESLDILEPLQSDADELGGSWPSMVLTTRANVLMDLGDLQTSLERYEQLRELAVANDDRMRIAIADGNIAGCYTRLGRYQAAIESFRRCQEVFEQLGHTPNVALTNLNLANVYLRVGNLDAALAAADSARAIFARTGARQREISAQLTMSDIQLERGGLHEARAATRVGLERAKAEGSERDVLRAFFSLGKIDAELDSLQTAAASMDSILRRTRASGELLQRVRAFAILGEIELERGRTDQAQERLEQAVALVKELGSPRYAVIPLVDLGRCLRAQGRDAEALERFRAAIDHVERIRWGTGAESERWSVFGQNLDPYAEAASVLLDTERWEEAFAMIESSRARTLLDRLAQLDVDLDADVSPELRRERRENLARTSFVRSRALAAEGEERAGLEAELDRLDAEFERIEGRIRQRQSPLSDLRRPEPATVPAIQARLGEDSVLLEFVFLASGAWCFTIEPGGGIRARELPADLSPRVVELRDLLIAGRVPASVDLDRCARLQHELYEDLIAANIAHLARLPSTIVLAPDGPLWSLPFEALLTLPPDGVVSASVLPELPYLFRAADLHVVPSATVWTRIAQDATPAAARDRPLLVFADPDYGIVASSADVASVNSSGRDDGTDAGPLLTRLAFAGEEAIQIEEAVGGSRVRVHRRESATEDRLKSEDLSLYGGLHFAAHSHVDEDHPQRTAVVLALDDDPTEDGFLTLREIYGLRLDADLVVLSTCSSARGRQVRGEGVIALVRAFLAAGARSALVSLWPVEDRSTSEFMAAFHASRAAGSSRSDAARAARLAMLESGRPAWALPYHWASFVLVGGP